ncbi:hypothetical protein NDU88_006043 [Pleurodeles waltl]|uniref:Uncharacterized protein n=1 Tax=Pleurodeles waltl TaxID=8319 RepID=A0AAV7QK09_PLEWA|nr:hypothetical protein NDU88_006043 [Pleurodeles waltl]
MSKDVDSGAPDLRWSQALAATSHLDASQLEPRGTAQQHDATPGTAGCETCVAARRLGTGNPPFCLLGQQTRCTVQQRQRHHLRRPRSRRNAIPGTTIGAGQQAEPAILPPRASGRNELRRRPHGCLWALLLRGPRICARRDPGHDVAGQYTEPEILPPFARSERSCDSAHAAICGLLLLGGPRILGDMTREHLDRSHGASTFPLRGCSRAPRDRGDPSPRGLEGVPLLRTRRPGCTN